MVQLVFPPEILLPLQWLLFTLVVLLIPVGILIGLVLYRLVSLMTQFGELFILVRHELIPILVDLRHSAGHLQGITEHMADGVNTVAKGVKASVPAMKHYAKRANHRIQNLLTSNHLEQLKTKLPTAETFKKLAGWFKAR
jgi:hypothetical protein